MKLRPRFSVRTLAIAVTLVCAYFGAWEATKRYGLTATTKEFRMVTKSGHQGTFVGGASESSPMPFLIRRNAIPVGNRYYLWLFGRKIRLFSESEWKEVSEFPNP